MLSKVNKIRKKARVTLYGSLEIVNKKCSKKGKLFYILALSDMKSSVEIGLISAVSNKYINNLIKKKRNRVIVNINPYSYYSKNITSVKYNKRQKHPQATLTIIGDNFDSKKK